MKRYSTTSAVVLLFWLVQLTCLWNIATQASSCITTELAYVYELVIGVIDISRTKEKGYETMEKESFCDELDELRQIYEELPEFLEEVPVI